MRLFSLAHLTTLAFLLLAERTKGDAQNGMDPKEYARDKLGHICIINLSCIDPSLRPPTKLFAIGNDAVWLHISDTDQQSNSGQGVLYEINWSQLIKDVGVKITAGPGTEIPQPGGNWGLNFQFNITVRVSDDPRTDQLLTTTPDGIALVPAGAVEASSKFWKPEDLPDGVEAPAFAVYIDYQVELPLKSKIPQGMHQKAGPGVILPPGDGSGSTSLMSIPGGGGSKLGKGTTGSSAVQGVKQIPVGGPGARFRQRHG